MRADDVLEVLAALGEAGVRTSLEGGWGVDALVGRQTREHDDLDLAVAREDCEKAVAALGARGFAHDESAWPGLPARLVLRDAGGRRVDLHPLVFDAAGNGWLELPEDGWSLHPADLLWHEGTVGGAPVACIAAELQLRFHLGYPWRDRDRHDLRVLAAARRIPLPPALAPR